MLTICFLLTIIIVTFYIPRSSDADTNGGGTINFIVGGVNARDGELPYQISLQYNKQHTCGGSIVANCWILTAAHCIMGSISTMTILAGTTKLNTGGKRVGVEKVVIHENFDKVSLANDIALIKLKPCLSFDRNINRVSVLRAYIDDGVIGTVSGWGFTNQNGTSDTNDLKKLNVRTITNQDCQTRLQFNIQAGELCTYNGIGQGFCQGDSGGPLIEDQTKAQMGIVSGNIPCARGKPDVYTRVSEYIDWIIDHAK